MEINNSSKPEVVIQCLIYNHENYLRDCLEGFVMQKTNFKFVVVAHDDASTDNSSEILLEYADKYPDIFIPIIEKMNLYSSHKARLGEVIDTACLETGAKYVAICEGDDYWIDPLKLQKEYDYMIQHQDCSLCGTNGFVMWEDYVAPASYFCNKAEGCDYSVKDLGKDWRMPTASLFYKKEVLEALLEWNDGFFHGDLRIMLTAATLGRVHYMPIISCVYRYSKKNLTSTTNLVGRNLGWAAKEMTRLYDYFDKWTQGKYAKEVAEIKRGIAVEERFYTYRDKNRALAAIMMPRYTFRLIRNLYKGKLLSYLGNK